MTTEHLDLRTVGATLVASFNRPDKRNAINMAMREGLAEAIAQLRDNRELRVLLIRANGGYFSSGIDLGETPFAEESELVRADSAPVAPGGHTMSEWRRLYRRPLHTMLDEIEAVEKPVVVAIQGPCLGLGVELSACVDFRLAADTASFGLPEINYGFIAGSGGVSRLTRLCGPAWSKWLNMTAETIDAETARIAGLIQAIYPAAEFEAQVMDFCARLAKRPAEAVAAAKLAIDLCADLDRASGRQVERLVNTPLVMAAQAMMAAPRK